MEKTNVIITIQSRQCFDTLEEDWVEQTAGGCLERTAEGWTLTYLEGETSGLGGTRTTLELAEGRITLTRAGEYQSQMVFEEGRGHTSDYKTPYGTLPLEIRTSRLFWAVEDRDGKAELDYRIQIGPQQSGLTQFRLWVKEKREEESK